MSCRHGWYSSGTPLFAPRTIRVAALAFVLLPFAVSAQESDRDLTEISLEDLLNIEVTSVARREQKLSQSPSAVYVITQEDIRRSGATSIPEALRMAPGVQVGQIDSNKWAVSIRGFSGRFAKKLLVMIDGRSVYHPAFAGVYWEANDLLLEDIERIEVIRGPGATLWGSNAVNGVINIITKNTRNTQGILVTAGGGNQEGGFGGARLGGEISPSVRYRFSSKYFSRTGGFLESGERAADNWLQLQGGFRVDMDPSPNDSVTVTSSFYDADGGDRQRITQLQAPHTQILSYRASFSGSNLFTHWTHKHAGGSTTQLQAFYDYSTRDDTYLRDTSTKVGDVEIQHQIDFARHRLVGGVGARVIQDDDPVDWAASYDPRHRTMNRVNAFLQDEIALVPDKLLLTVGSKFENNSFTAWEVQPSVSLLWNRTTKDTAWISFARAARTPARVDHDIVYRAFSAPGPEGSTLIGVTYGNQEIGSENLLTYEAGYRFSPVKKVSFDLTGFYNQYKDVVLAVPSQRVPAEVYPGITIVPFEFANRLSPTLYGAEIAAAWKPDDNIDLRLNYSYLRGEFANDSALLGPGNQLHARWFWTLRDRIEWDSSYYFADQFSGVRAYHRVDTRIGYRLSRGWEFSVVGQNLLDNKHVESPALLILPTQIGRSIYGRFTWRIDTR